MIAALRWNLFALLLAITLPASAGFADKAGGEDEFLSVDAAFTPQTPQRNPDGLSMGWEIAPGYYLYRHSLRFKLIDTTATLGTAILPEGKHKHDEYFGDVQTYTDTLTAQLPLSGSVPDAMLTLEVRYQGCADKGLCYPPVTRQFKIAALDAGAAKAGANTAISPTSPLSAEAQLAARLAQDNLAWVILQFLGFGLLLAFTPCVLPMLPILASVVAGSHARSTRQGFLLALTYVLAMALAYTVFGVIAGLFGHNLQALLQAPAVILSFSAVFVVLALAMFGFYELGLPSRLQSALTQMSSRQQSGTYVGAALMGFLGALIAGPCIAPPLAGALLYIGQSGDPWLGGMALFSLGIGMGLPLLVLGSFEGRFLPRAGAWMTRINHAFGFLLLGIAIWLATRILPAPWPLLTWAVLAYGGAFYLLLLVIENPARRLLAILPALALASYGALLIAGAITGARDPLNPLPASGTTRHNNAVPFQPIQSLTELKSILKSSKGPVILDYYADWCVACRKLEQDIFPAPQVQVLLNQFTRLRIDLTRYTEQDRELLSAYQLAGPPALLFFHDARELTALRQLGEPNATELAAHLQEVLDSMK